MTSPFCFLLTLTLLLVGGAHSRSINETEFVIETLFFVEPEVVEHYEDLGFKDNATQVIEAEVHYMVYLINKYFATLKPYGLHIEIRMTQVCVEKALSGLGLGFIKIWAKTLGIPFDFAVLLQQTNPSSGTVDYDKACTSGAVSHVRFRNPRLTAAMIVFVIAGNLGVSTYIKREDECGKPDKMLSTPYYYPTTFSSCAGKDLRKQIESLIAHNMSCWEETTIQKTTFDLSKYGYLLEPNFICQQAFTNNQSFFAQGACDPKSMKGDDVCHWMRCGTYSPTGWEKCQFTGTPDGMVCDVGKRCSMGKCVPAPSNFPVPTSVTSDCVFGDMKYVLGTTDSCKEHVRKMGDSVCYDEKTWKMCCGTCGARKVSLEDSSKQTDIVVEALFVVEPQVTSNYVSLGYDKSTAVTTVRNEMDFMVYEINKYFNTLKTYGLNVEIRLKKLIMTKENDLFEDKRPETTRLSVAVEWLKIQKETFDLAVLWHGYDNFTKDADNVGTVCSDKAVVAVQYEGIQKTAANAAREIRMSLAHEYYYGGNRSQGYVMSGQVYPTPEQPDAFTSLDASDVKKNLKMLESSGTNCLKQTTTKAKTFDPSSSAYNDILDLSTQCMRMMKKKDAYFQDVRQLKGDSVCRNITCRVVGKVTTYSQNDATDGVVCDVGKRCSMGSCVPASKDFPLPISVTSECLWGDTKYVEGQSCVDYLSKQGDYKCYSLYHTCCVSCQTKETGIEGCEYGDRRPECATDRAENVCPYYKDACCETCRNYRQ